MMNENSYHRVLIVGTTSEKVNVRAIAPAEIRIADSKESAIEAIRQGVQDWRSSVHVILTGSAQDYYLGTALSLFGREQDRLYDQNMAPLPFVPLRGNLPQSFLTGRVPFEDALAAAKRALQEPLLEIDIPSGTVRADGRIVTRDPAQVALCWWFAEAVDMMDPAVDFCAPESKESFLERMRPFVHEESAEMRRAKAGLGVFKGEEERYAFEEKAYFSPLMGMLEKSFEEALGASAAKRYAIHDYGFFGAVGERRYGFTLGTRHVRIHTGGKE
jgi:hypothetical protein